MVYLDLSHCCLQISMRCFQNQNKIKILNSTLKMVFKYLEVDFR